MIATRALQIAKIAAWCALAMLLVTVADVVRQIPTLVTEQAGITRTMIAQELGLTRTLLDNRTLDALSEVRTATAVVNARSQQALDELTATRRSITVQGLGVAGRIDSRLGEATAEVAALRSELKPVLAVAAGAGASYARLAESARSTVDDAHPEAVKLLRDARATAAQTGRAAGQVERAMPQIIGDVKRATDASADASEHASATFANLEKQTKPTNLLLRLMPEALRTAIIAIGFLK